MHHVDFLECEKHERFHLMVCQNPNPTRMQCFCTSHWVAPGLGHKHSPQKASGDPAQKGQNKHSVPTPKVTFICNAVTPWYSGRKEWKMGRSSFIAAKGEVEVLGSACSSVAVAHHSPASLQPHVGPGHGIRDIRFGTQNHPGS